MRNRHNGKTQTDESNQKRSQKLKNRIMTEHHRNSTGKALKRIIFSPETLLKMSLAEKGKYDGANNPMYGINDPIISLEINRE